MPNLDSELTFTYSRSGGSGGQHVNKVSTKALLKFDIQASQVLTTHQKTLIQEKLSNHINQEGIFQVSCDATRSQLKNKEIAITKFNELIKKALIQPKKRKKLKIPKSVKEKRLKDKKLKSLKKQNRRKDNWD